jgi:hypothetical protein
MASSAELRQDEDCAGFAVYSPIRKNGRAYTAGLIKAR